MFSTLPILFAAEIIFIIRLGLKSSSSGLSAVLIWITALTIWGSTSVWMALNGIYNAPWFLSLLPGLWIPAVPFAISGLCWLMPIVRSGLKSIATQTPLHWFIAVQTLRLAALGTLFKTLSGQFPVVVELAIGITDLAFGLSALWLMGPAKRQQISPDALAIWHLVGVAIILLPGEIAIQTGLPGPLQVFTQFPTSQVMFDWPMVLAPSLIVPILLLLDLLGVASSLHQSNPLSNKEILVLLQRLEELKKLFPSHPYINESFQELVDGRDLSSDGVIEP